MGRRAADCHNNDEHIRERYRHACPPTQDDPQTAQNLARAWKRVSGCRLLLMYSVRPRSLRVRYDRRKHLVTVPDDKREAVRQIFDGASGIETVKHPDRVDVFRIGPPSPRGRKEGRIDDYPILAGPISVPQDMQAGLSNSLLSPDSYVWETLKGCLPEFGVCLSFYRKAERVDVFLCFECDILMISHNGLASGGEDFDHIHPALVRVAKQLFADDHVIQAL